MAKQELSVDFLEAFESMKLAIIRQHATDWDGADRESVRSVLMALVEMAWMKSDSLALSGKWRVGDEGIYCGTLRIARWDFDTDPSPEFRAQLSEQMAKALNLHRIELDGTRLR